MTNLWPVAYKKVGYGEIKLLLSGFWNGEEEP